MQQVAGPVRIVFLTNCTVRLVSEEVYHILSVIDFSHVLQGVHAGYSKGLL